mmetsp:Transcript_30406/g.77608  ORF Transcript_30406/g.77608 Transcript_30406/m.77608 type:complete len:271 (-) Transcript_30406:331-1143(-)
MYASLRSLDLAADCLLARMRLTRLGSSSMSSCSLLPLPLLVPFFMAVLFCGLSSRASAACLRSSACAACAPCVCCATTGSPCAPPLPLRLELPAAPAAAGTAPSKLPPLDPLIPSASYMWSPSPDSSSPSSSSPSCCSSLIRPATLMVRSSLTWLPPSGGPGPQGSCGACAPCLDMAVSITAWDMGMGAGPLYSTSMDSPGRPFLPWLWLVVCDGEGPPRPGIVVWKGPPISPENVAAGPRKAHVSLYALLCLDRGMAGCGGMAWSAAHA